MAIPLVGSPAPTAPNSWKSAVKAATTVTGTLSTAYENGDTVDGVTLATGDRILIKDQSTGSENGIYIVNASGAPSRASDMNTSAKAAGTQVYVEQGTVNGDSIWFMTNNSPLTLGTTGLLFSRLVPGDAFADIFTDQNNDRFNSSTGSWTNSGGTMTRDTTAGKLWTSTVSSATMKFVTTTNGQYVQLALPGTFLVGVEYHAQVVIATEETGAAAAEWALGVYGTDYVGENVFIGGGEYFTDLTTHGAGAYATFNARWTPSANTASAVVRFSRTESSAAGTKTYHLAFVRVVRALRNREGLNLTGWPVPITGGSSGGTGTTSTTNGMALMFAPGTQQIRVTSGSLFGGGVVWRSDGGTEIESFTGDSYVLASGYQAQSVSIHGGFDPGSIGNLIGNGVNIEAGDDYVGIWISEKDSSTVQIYGDTSGTSVEFRDRTGAFYSASANERWVINNATHALNAAFAPVAIANTETVVLGKSLPANFMANWWPTFRIQGYGRLTTGGTPGSSVFRIRIGGTTLTGTVATTLTLVNATSVTNGPFKFDALITVRTEGASGTAIGNMSVSGGVTAAFTVPADVSAQSATITVNTTAVNLIELTYISGNAGSTATFEHAMIEVLRTQ